MISRNIRHLRLFVLVADHGSVTKAAEVANLSQPAVTQAINKLEAEAGGPLFRRTRQGFFLNRRGAALLARLRRLFARLDPALADISPRLILTATAPQLRALVAVWEVQNFTLAARRLGVAQPTVHRAVRTLEQEAGQPLFERASFGMLATRPCQALAQAARLAFAELAQADAEMEEFNGRDTGQVVIGALPLSRSVLLPRALVAFRRIRPAVLVTVIDGLYADLLGDLRRGTIDMIVGALRDPAPIGDIVQEPLFDDSLEILAGNHHPLVGRRDVSLADLAEFPWVVPRANVPTRRQFDAFLAPLGIDRPARIIETGSIILMREILDASDHLGCISRQQAQAELAKGLLSRIDITPGWTGRPIGLTFRSDWVPTRAQRQMIELIRGAVPDD